jgi:hypothetical protein
VLQFLKEAVKALDRLADNLNATLGFLKSCENQSNLRVLLLVKEVQFRDKNILIILTLDAVCSEFGIDLILQRGEVAL